MKVILFGANGFVGKQIAEALPGAFTPTSSEANLLDVNSIKKFFATQVSEGCSVIFSAAKTSYAVTPKDDFVKMQDNVAMAQNFIAALPSDVKEIIYLSTIDVYGKPELPVTESSAISPQSNYAAAKAAAELIFIAACKIKQVPLLVLRLSQVYGRGDNSPKAIPNMVRSVNETGSVKITGDGKLKRDFVHVNDVASIVKESIGRKLSDVLNVVTGKSETLIDTAQAIINVSGKQAKIELQPGGHNTFDLVFDNERLTKTFPDFRFMDLREGLQQTMS